MVMVITRPVLLARWISTHLEALCVAAACRTCAYNLYKLSSNTPEIDERQQRGQSGEKVSCLIL